MVEERTRNHDHCLSLTQLKNRGRLARHKANYKAGFERSRQHGRSLECFARHIAGTTVHKAMRVLGGGAAADRIVRRVRKLSDLWEAPSKLVPLLMDAQAHVQGLVVMATR
jgi:hypothetical protein